MSGNGVAQRYAALRQTYLSLRDRPLDDGAFEELTNLDRQLRDIIDDSENEYGESAVRVLERSTKSLDTENNGLQRELTRLENELAAERAEQAQARALGVDGQTVEDHSAVLREVQDRVLYQSYCRQLCDLRGGLANAKTVLQAVVTKSTEDISEDRVSAADLRFVDPSVWADKQAQLERLLSAVQAKTAQVHRPHPLTEMQILAEVKQLAAEAIAHVAVGFEERQEREGQLRVFFSECEKLTAWCRQQAANLDAMREPDHIQEYCRTLVDNYTTMSNNCSVLVESVDTNVRASNEAVKKALSEVSQVWCNILVSALERLSKTLFEVHPKSTLEEEVEKYADYPKHLVHLLHTIRLMLQQETSLSQEGGEVLKDCEELAADVSGHEAAAVLGLRDFAARFRAKRKAYACFQQAILSRLTYASMPADVVLESRRRQGEFEQCVTKLKKWAATQAHGESWRDIYSKIVEIKRVIQHEQEYIDERADEPVN